MDVQKIQTFVKGLDTKILLGVALGLPIFKMLLNGLQTWLMQNLPGLPESLQRILIRSHLKWWSSRLACGGDVEKQHFYKEKLVKVFRENEKIAEATEEAKEQHYEVPTEFFKLSLGKWLKYSSCYYPEGCNDLTQAEEAMLEKICARAQLKDGLDVLDLGCGWGSCGLYLLNKYPKIRVTFFSNSVTQQAYIKEQAAKIGATDRIRSIAGDVNVTEILDDSGKTREFDRIRSIAGDVNVTEILDESGKTREFDRILTNEMFEHMKNYEKLFEKVSKWLKPDTGLLFIHVFCHKNFPYEFKVKSSNNADWMARNFFTGGTMPAFDTFLFFQKHLAIQNTWMVNGVHYSKTLEAWLVLLKQREAEISKIFAKAYGEKNVTKQLNDWKLFYIMSSEAFAYNNGNDWCVAHYTFKRNK